MKKLSLLLFVLSFAFIMAGCAEKPASTDTAVKEPIFFYSNTCGHCQKVKQYIADNKIKDKVSYSEVEAFSTEENLNLFNEKATACGIPEEQRGVPLIFEKGKCYVGSVEGIDYFKNKAGL